MEERGAIQACLKGGIVRAILAGLALPMALGVAACSQQTTAEAGEDAPVTTVSMEPAAVMERWERELGGRYRAAAALDEAQFVDAWDADFAGWRDELEATGAAAIDLERVRYEWAFARLLYPVYHARITGEDRQPVSQSYNAYLNQIELERPDLLGLEEYTGFIETMAEMRADEVFLSEDFEGTPGALYLDARLQSLDIFTDPEVNCYLQAQIFEYWLERFDGYAATHQLDRFAADCPGDTAQTLVTRFAEERENQQGHPVEIYKSVEGYDLTAHIFAPEGHTPEAPRPAVLWFHGGGWYFGNWSWCGPCRFFKERGHVVIQIEYRIHGRFRSRAGDSLNDVTDAIAWARDNADRLGIDPNRIAASGFSAGGHLSMTSGALTAQGDPGRPDLIAAFSGCADMTDAPYEIRMSGSLEEATRLSPVLIENPSSPPIFFANARQDTDCDFERVSAYAANLVAAGNTATLHDGGERGHFFMRDPEAAAAVQADLNAFLDAQGW